MEDVTSEKKRDVLLMICSYLESSETIESPAAYQFSVVVCTIVTSSMSCTLQWDLDFASSACFYSMNGWCVLFYSHPLQILDTLESLLRQGIQFEKGFLSNLSCMLFQMLSTPAPSQGSLRCSVPFALAAYIAPFSYP